ncbi:hypothetical protein [Burkholderia sp. LMG 32019]|uniref:hypothetical protein n=1 Tax=Burkholderia sp. LMG 32019 TaxID=3158173 RepID=UPI003C2BE250
MKIAKTDVLIAVAFLPAFVGFFLVESVLTELGSFAQLDRLVSFGYMSFVDSLLVGGQRGVADCFFFGVGFLLLAALVLTKSPELERMARRVACALFLFLACCLAYACIHPRIGEVPDGYPSAAVTK